MPKIIKSKKSFTLVEVLVAVSILSFVGVVLLKILSTNTFFIAHHLKKNTFFSFVSLVGQNINKEDNKENLHVKDLVSSKYPKISDSLLDFIKDKKIHYEEKEISVVSILDNFSKQEQTEAQDADESYIKIKVIKKFVSFVSDKKEEQSLEYLYSIVESVEDDQDIL